MYIDINVLQTVPASNINRDETGAPKTVVYGGVTRTRVSSQSWKHAVRQAFGKENKDADWLMGVRTSLGPTLLQKKIMATNNNIDSDTALLMAENAFEIAGLSVDSGKHKTKTSTLLSRGQLDRLAAFVVDHQDEFSAKSVAEAKKKYKADVRNAIKEGSSADLALFGRMVADDNVLTVDGAAQVAHAISTHEIVPEFDYFTTTDDAKGPEDDRGASMVGTIEYDSATLYRYANVNIPELIYNLGDAHRAGEALRYFIKDFIMSMPTGKQHSFANKTVPQYVMITLRPDTPVNLVSGFEDPVLATHGYVAPSIKKLEEEYAKTGKIVEKPIATYVLTTEETGMTDNAADSLTDLLDKVETAVKPALEEGADDEDSDN